MILADGILNVALVVFHLALWRLFRWGTELGKVSPINRGVMQVLNLCLMFVFLVYVQRHHEHMWFTRVPRSSGDEPQLY